MTTKHEKIISVTIGISEGLLAFASEYSTLIGLPLEKLLYKEMKMSLKTARAKVRELPFTNMEHIIEARNQAITSAIEQSQKEANHEQTESSMPV